MGIADPVNLSDQSTLAAAKGVIRRFLPPFPPPEAARVARIEVESIIQVSRSIKPSLRNRMCNRERTC